MRYFYFAVFLVRDDYNQNTVGISGLVLVIGSCSTILSSVPMTDSHGEMAFFTLQFS